MTSTPPKKKGGRRHKAKGDKYERELADYLNKSIWPHANPPQVHRTPLSGSFSVIKGVGSADLTGTPGLWVEAKRTETIRPHEFMAQARRGTLAFGSVDTPIVITRRSQQSTEDSLVLLSLKDFIPFYHAWLSQKGFVPAASEPFAFAEPSPQLPLPISF